MQYRSGYYARYSVKHWWRWACSDPWIWETKVAQRVWSWYQIICCEYMHTLNGILYLFDKRSKADHLHVRVS